MEVFTKRFLIHLLFICCFVRPLITHAQTQVFGDDFESGNYDNWQGGVNRNQLIIARNQVLKVRGGEFNGSTIQGITATAQNPVTEADGFSLSFAYYREAGTFMDESIQLADGESSGESVLLHLRENKALIKSANQVLEYSLGDFTGNAYHISFHIYPHRNSVELYIDGEKVFQEYFPETVKLATVFDRLSLSTLSLEGYFTLDNVGLLPIDYSTNASQTPIFFDDFEEGNYDNWIGGVNREELIVEEESPKNNLLRVRGGEFNGNTIKWLQATAQNPVPEVDYFELSFDYFREMGTTANERLMLTDSSNKDSKISIHVRNGGIIANVQDQSSSQHIGDLTGRTHKFMFQFYREANLVKGYMDDKLILYKTFPSSVQISSNLNKLQLSTWSTGGYFDLDNITWVAKTLEPSIPEAYLGTSRLWTEFTNAPTPGVGTHLPDYSYAGYKMSEEEIPFVEGPIFDVTDFGAIPNDSLEDYEGIQNAIYAAEANGGGVVFFPPGRFLLNEEVPSIGLRVRPSITITGDNIVLRGSGDFEEGTVLYCRYNRTATLKFNIQASGNCDFQNRKILSQISANAARGSRQIRVESTADIRVGDEIIIELGDSSIWNPSFIAPYESDFSRFEKDWERMLEGRFVQEFHQVTAIDGNLITLESPLKVEVNVNYDWFVRRGGCSKGFGLENFMFIGESTPDFKHHYNSGIDNTIRENGLNDTDYHNGGFSAVRIVCFRDSWVRNVKFKNWSNSLGLNRCINSTATDIEIVGHRGHNSVQSFRSHNILFNRIIDKAETWHGPETSHTSSGAVFRDCSWREWAAIDTHSGHPYTTLVDNSFGGMAGPAGGGGVLYLIMVRILHTGTLPKGMLKLVQSITG